MPSWLKAQAEIKNPHKTREVKFKTTFYKYALLSDILDQNRAILLKHQLLIAQNIVSDETSVGVQSTLYHESGQFIETDVLRIPLSSGSQASGAQAIGVFITYARRYQLCAFLGIAGADDTDGMVKKDEPEDMSALMNKQAPKNLITALYAEADLKGYNKEAMNQSTHVKFKKTMDEITMKEYVEISDIIGSLADRKPQKAEQITIKKGE